MATLYVRSTDGGDGDSGASWALAKATIKGAADADTAGDVIYVSQDHAESNVTANVTWNFAGTLSSPVKVVGANDAAEPPTAYASSKPSVSTSSAWGLTVNGSVLIDSIAFNLGSGASNPTMTMSATPGNIQRYKNCDFALVATGTGNFSVTSGNSNEKTIWENCNVKFAGASQVIQAGRGEFWWYGGGITSGSTSPTNLFNNPGSNGSMHVFMEGVDLSNGGSSMNIFNSGSGVGAVCTMRNCKLPASWSGSLVSGTIHPASRFEMHNCDSADTNYRLWIEDFTGSIKTETTLVKTGGASDGTTGFSYKMASNTSANQHNHQLIVPIVGRWNDTVGSSVTLTLDILHDSATNLKDDEIWIIVEYLGTSGYPLASFANDAKSGFFATAADQTASSVTWTTTGMSNPNKQKLSVSVTPQEKGYIQAYVCLAAASKTVYIDPVLQVS